MSPSPVNRCINVTNDAKRTFDTVKRRLVRAGNRWFFYDEEVDRDFFEE